MKLLTLLTTLIITLASSNVFSETFICEKWKDITTGKYEGTVFIGEVTDDEYLIIKDQYETKRILTYIGAGVVQNYYTTKYNGFVRFFFIAKYSKDGKTELGKYDLKIAEFFEGGIMYETFCNYQ